MRIAFIVIGNSRRSNYLNGFNLRYGNGGGSGTDTSSVLMAEYLAKQGHDVVFVTEKLEPQLEQEYQSRGRKYTPGESFYGVRYTNLDFDGIEDKNFDILVSMLWFHDYNKLPITVSKGLIYWSHMQWIYGINEIMDYTKQNNLSLGFVHISDWEKGMTGDLTESIKNNNTDINVQVTTIPNPIMDEMINQVLSSNPRRKQHKFVFHAAWARGGNVAVQAVRELDYPDTEFHSFDYLMATHHHQDPFFNLHNGVDKKTLFTNIAESEYFIYPLYTPYQDVHKDTFSCVVAEAIAMGVIVVTYPLGALPENFNDYCAWLDAPPGANFEEMQKQQLSKDENEIFTYTDNIVEKINYLEANPSEKEKLRQGGDQYILDNFNIDKIGKIWDELIEDLIRIKEEMPK